MNVVLNSSPVMRNCRRRLDQVIEHITDVMRIRRCWVGLGSPERGHERTVRRDPGEQRFGKAVRARTDDDNVAAGLDEDPVHIGVIDLGGLDARRAEVESFDPSAFSRKSSPCDGATADPSAMFNCPRTRSRPCPSTATPVAASSTGYFEEKLGRCSVGDRQRPRRSERGVGRAIDVQSHRSHLGIIRAGGIGAKPTRTILPSVCSAPKRQRPPRFGKLFDPSRPVRQVQGPVRIDFRGDRMDDPGRVVRLAGDEYLAVRQ